MCLYPRMFKNPKYRANKKNGGVIPTISDERTLMVPIGCSKCMECKRRKANEWKARLMEDIKHEKNGRFITLTLSNESYQKLDKEIPKTMVKGKYVDGVYHEKEVEICGYLRDNEIITRGVRLFLERWRKKYKTSLRHWFVTELGHNGTENIHIHGIVWQPEGWPYTWMEFMKEVGKVWQYGFTWRFKKEKNRLTGKIEPVNYVSDKTINYVIKYVLKVDKDHKLYDSKILTSAGIGRGYTEKVEEIKYQCTFKDKWGKWSVRTYKKKVKLKPKGNWLNNVFKGADTDETYRTRSGHKISLPIYWRNKIYSDEEREKLWIIKLDKQERWVCGERVDISESERGYYALLDHYRRINDELGYGNDKVDWSRQKYEHERRIIMQRARLGYEYPIEWDA